MKTTLYKLLLAIAVNYSVSAIAFAGESYNDLEDAAVAQAKSWQKGGKARPLMSSDGMVRFAYGQSMPKLTCSPTRACDMETQPGEKVKKVILGDSANWSWLGAESVEHGVVIQHLVFQPRDSAVESNAIITTDRRTYHIKLYSPKTEGAYLNRIGFYYPEELVSDWNEKAGSIAAETEKIESKQVLDSAVDINKLDYNYLITGTAQFKPVRAFNDGGRVYIEMPKSIKAEESPILLLLDENNKVQVVNYRVKNDTETGKIHYVVDKLFTQAELRLDNQRVKITWQRKERNVPEPVKHNALGTY